MHVRGEAQSYGGKNRWQGVFSTLNFPQYFVYQRMITAPESTIMVADSYTSGGASKGVGGENEHRVVRGGAWALTEHFVRAACRYHMLPALRNAVVGFRLAHEV